MIELPPKIDWIAENLKGSSFFKSGVISEIFKYSTEELIKKYNNTQELIYLLLAERFIWENIQNGFYSVKILVPILEKREIAGYLFCFPEKSLLQIKKKLLSGITFIKFDENHYFYPSEWENILKFLFALWKNNIEFCCVEIILKKEDFLKFSKNFIKLARILDFSFLSQSTLESLKGYLPTLDVKKLSEITNRFLRIPESALILSSKEEIKEFLKKSDVEVVESIIGKNSLFLVKKADLKKILALEGEFEKIKVGVLPKEVWKKFKRKGTSPLMFLIGAFEHARRMNDVKVKVFEGFTYHVIGDLYYEWKDFGKALKYYLVAEDYTIQPVELILSKSAIYYTFGDIEKAEKILRKALCGCKKEDPLIHHNLGLIYLKKEEFERAKYHFYKAHLLEPENLIFREALIKCLWDLGEYEELEEFLDSIKEHSLKEKMYLGKLHFYKKNYKTAFKYLKEILAHKERDGESLIFLAWLYLYFNKEKEVSRILLKEAREILSLEEIERIKRDFGLELQ